MIYGFPEWIVIWWYADILALVIVLARNYRMTKKGSMDALGKKVISLMVVNSALMLIVLIISKASNWGLFSVSLLFSVFVFTGGVLLDKKSMDEVKGKLDSIDERLKRIESRLDGLHKK